jgi:hypothetical protein
MKPAALNATSEMTLKVDTRDMSPAQVRVLKQVHALMIHTITAEDEAEYFEAAAQLFKQTAQLVRHANFADDKRIDGIAYGEQAVDYAVDFLKEMLSAQTNLDN